MPAEYVMPNHLLDRGKKDWLILLAALLILLSVPGGFLYYKYGTIRTIEFRVNKTEDARLKGSHRSYMVYTDKGVFENARSVWHWKRDHSELHNMLLVHERYRCKVYGWRILLLDWYPNLISCSQLLKPRLYPLLQKL